MKKLQTNTVKGSNIKLKTLKEENKMKNTTLTAALIITMLFIFSTISYAQGHSSAQNGAIGYAYHAQKELRKAERAEKAKREFITVSNVEKEHVTGRNETDSVERAELVEYKYSD